MCWLMLRSVVGKRSIGPVLNSKILLICSAGVRER